MPKPKRAVIRDDGVRYESTSAAAKAVAGDQTNISRACRTGCKAYGYLWGYADEPGSVATSARAARNRREESPYRFPPNKQASGAGFALQAEKVVEEAAEVKSAVLAGLDEDDIAHEAWDVIQAAEGILRKMPDETVRLAHAAVMLRCSRRGDYNTEDRANWEKD